MIANREVNMNRYIVFLAGGPPEQTFSKVLGSLPDVTIIEELDSSTVLVEMTDRGRKQLERALPDASVEPNIVYRLHA